MVSRFAAFAAIVSGVAAFAAIVSRFAAFAAIVPAVATFAAITSVTTVTPTAAFAAIRPSGLEDRFCPI